MSSSRSVIEVGKNTKSPLQEGGVVPVGLEPTTKRFTFHTFQYGVGLSHHPQSLRIASC